MEMNFANRFKEVRIAKNLTQTECAEKLQISLQTVNRLERGHRTPDAELAVRIAETFNCGLVWLLTGRPQESGSACSGHSCPLLSVLPLDLTTPPKEAIEGWISFPELPSGTMAIRCRDDAMSPLVKWGDLVIFAVGECHPGNLAVLADQMGQASIRRMHVVMGLPTFLVENQEYVRREGQPELRCVGRVIKIVRDIPS